MPGSVASAVGSAVASKAIGSLMGGGKKSSGGGASATGGMTVPQFLAGGLDFTYNMSDPSKLYVNHSKYSAGAMQDPSVQLRQKSIADIVSAYKNQATDIRGQIPQAQGFFGDAISSLTRNIAEVRPGFGRLTDARVQSVRNAGEAERSDLRSNLAKRRVLGSSFAGDALTRQGLETGQQEAAVRAQSFLEELDLETKLIGDRLATQISSLDYTRDLANQAFSADRAASQTDLDELNTQLAVVTGIIGTMGQIAQQNAALEAQYAAQGAAARGGMIGDIAGPIGRGFGNMVGGFSDFVGTGGQGFNFGNIFGAATGAYGPGF